MAAMVLGRNGNLYGTTRWGGYERDPLCGYQTDFGCGTVFEIGLKGFRQLYAFCRQIRLYRWRFSLWRTCPGYRRRPLWRNLGRRREWPGRGLQNHTQWKPNHSLQFLLGSELYGRAAAGLTASGDRQKLLWYDDIRRGGRKLLF